jgi:hypothetical protein
MGHRGGPVGVGTAMVSAPHMCPNPTPTRGGENAHMHGDASPSHQTPWAQQ